MHVRFASLSRVLALVGAVLVLTVLLVTKPVYAATLPSGFTESLVASGLSNPTAFDFAPDGRVFVTQQGGALRVIKNGALLATPFLTVTTDSSGERGLLGIAFDPAFGTNNYLYVYYTVPGSPPHNRVSRFTANGDVVVAGSELPILDLENLSGAQNHNGGAIHFSSDDKLYVAVGENGNPANSQTLNNRLGKILRLNTDGTVPTDNPFYNTATGDKRSIWAMGLRNPFTFAFQPGTGRLFLNDVGQGSREEINDGIAGSNYGWNICEGSCNPANAAYRDPLLQYPHSGGAFNGCSIVGGAFYNPTTTVFPADYTNDYFFADLCGGWIRRYDIASNTSAVFATGISSPVDLHVNPDGSLYYLARGTSQIWRITYDPLANTNTPTRTNTTAPNTATRTNTAAPNTATRTNTAAPNTATRTRTNTPVPNSPTRTNTAVPNTATRTHTPTRTFTPTRFLSPTATPIGGTWTFCAKQNRTCTVPGTRIVRFGANGKYTYATITNSVKCNQIVFGDPIQGVAKTCDYASAGAPRPTNTPTPTPKKK